MAWANNDYSKSETILQRLVEVQPYIPAYRIALGRAQFLTENFDEAGSNFDILLKKYPNYPFVNYLRAFGAYQKGDYQAAQVHTDKVLAVDANHLPSFLLSGAANYALGRFEQVFQPIKLFC